VLDYLWKRMAKCKECGNEINSEWSTCPQCGSNFRRTQGILIALLVLTVLALVSIMSR
jgi:predicted Zn-ribbon and HTH transcriptional regulator